MPNTKSKPKPCQHHLDAIATHLDLLEKALNHYKDRCKQLHAMAISYQTLRDRVSFNSKIAPEEILEILKGLPRGSIPKSHLER